MSLASRIRSLTAGQVVVGWLFSLTLAACASVAVLLAAAEWRSEYERRVPSRLAECLSDTVAAVAFTPAESLLDVEEVLQRQQQGLTGPGRAGETWLDSALRRDAIAVDSVSRRREDSIRAALGPSLVAAYERKADSVSLWRLDCRLAWADSVVSARLYRQEGRTSLLVIAGNALLLLGLLAATFVWLGKRDARAESGSESPS